jgi:hypothetical protein
MSANAKPNVAPANAAASTPTIHVPVAALRRFANDLESDVAATKFLQVNRERVNEFIDKKPQGFSKGSTVKAGRTLVVPGVLDYSKMNPDAPTPIIQLQRVPEFQPSLGPRSRFGEGDGSFFDQWLNSDIAKSKHLFDKDGFPVLR